VRKKEFSLYTVQGLCRLKTFATTVFGTGMRAPTMFAVSAGRLQKAQKKRYFFDHAEGSESTLKLMEKNIKL
jgi:hypothetical protein